MFSPTAWFRTFFLVFALFAATQVARAIEVVSSIRYEQYWTLCNMYLNFYPFIRIGEADAELNSLTYMIEPNGSGNTMTAYVYEFPLVDGAPGKLLGQTSGVLINWADVRKRVVLPMAPKITLAANTAYVVRAVSSGDNIMIQVSEKTDWAGISGWVIGDAYRLYANYPPEVGTYVPMFAVDATILAPSKNYAEWAGRRFSPEELKVAAVAGATADPDRSGYANLQRYAFGLLARGPVASPIAQTTVAEGGKTYAAVRFKSVAAGNDITYAVEGSSDLATWATVKTFAAGTAVEQTVRDTVAMSGATRRFLRVRVTLAP